MNLKNRVLLFCLGVLLADQSTGQRVDSLLLRYNQQVPQEKIHVQFDNTVYTPGQTIWFKAYLMSGAQTSSLSRNFYIDWYDDKGKLINQVVEPVIYASAAGSFTIPEKYAGEQVQAVAYTRWMLNFDSAFLFRKKLAVAQSHTEAAKSKAGIPLTHVGFFPEGGDMVEGLPSVVAFKAMSTTGLPATVTGSVRNKASQVIATFHSEHDGMGSIQLTPLPGETYTATWKDETGAEGNAILPAAQKEGVVLQLDGGQGDRVFHISRSENIPLSLKKIIIVASMNQEVLFQATATLAEKKRITGNLPLLQFPSGVLQLTLFDLNHQPVAERILFVNNDEYRLAANVNFDTLNLDKRGKNTYEISLPDSIPANMSLAVTDGEAGIDSSANIISQLLLSSEIRGHIHNPQYYFSSDDSTVSRQLDCVMLTNGWRRFRWEDIWARKTPALRYHRDSSYLSIAGKIDGLKDTKIKKAQFVNLIVMAKDSSRQFIFSPLKPDGRFEENNLILFDTARVFYQLNGTSLPGRSKVAIGNGFVQPDKNYQLPPVPPYFIIDTAGLARINEINREQQRLNELMRQATLQEVTVTARVKSRLEEMDEKYANGMFHGANAYQFNLVDDPTVTSSGTVLAYLQSRVAGLQISHAYSMDATANWRGSPTSYFIDQIPSDANRLNSMPMSDVAYIKVFRPPFMGASGGGAGGAIAVYTKRGDDARSTFSELDNVLLPGYTRVKEFYHPDYAEQQATYTQTDLRRTLYWKPFLLTDGISQKIKLSFYNNDISRRLLFVLEGVANDGRFIHISKLLQ